MNSKVQSFSTLGDLQALQRSARNYPSYLTQLSYLPNYPHCYCFANLHFVRYWTKSQREYFQLPMRSSTVLRAPTVWGIPLEEGRAPFRSDHHTVRRSCCGLRGAAWGVEDLLTVQALLCGRVWYVNGRWNWSSRVGCTALRFTCNRRSPTRNKSYSFFLQLLQVVFYDFFSLQKRKFTSATKNTCLDQNVLGWKPVKWPDLCKDPTWKHRAPHTCCPRLKSNQPSSEWQQQLHCL